jgi:hypothetical protein
MVNIGDSIIFVDTSRVEHEALVTTVHGSEYTRITEGKEVICQPCINLVYVSDLESKQDQYGRQLERASSVQHVGAWSSSPESAGYCYKTK